MCAIIPTILVMHDACSSNSSIQKLLAGLNDSNAVCTAADIEEAMTLLDENTGCALIDWDLENDPAHEAASLLLGNIKANFPDLPVFLLLAPENTEMFDRNTLAAIDGFFWLDDNPSEIAAEITRAIRRSEIVSVLGGRSLTCEMHSVDIPAIIPQFSAPPLEFAHAM